MEPAHRGKGVGKALLIHVAKIAVERGCGRFEWAVLDWNTPSIDFYKSLGAVPLDDWTLFRLTGDTLHRVAAAHRLFSPGAVPRSTVLGTWGRAMLANSRTHACAYPSCDVQFGQRTARIGMTVPQNGHSLVVGVAGAG